MASRHRSQDACADLRGHAHSAVRSRRSCASPTRSSATGDVMPINFGPNHPSTHGVLRLIVDLYGEDVVGLEAIVGYLHTGFEKTMEQKTWWKAITYPERIDYLSFQNNELVFVLAIEQLLELEIPPKASWMRTLLCELNRIHSHLIWLGDRRARAGCDLDVLVLLPRARAGDGPLRARHRRAHAHAVLPGRRARRGHPARVLRRVPALRRLDAEGRRRVREPRRPERDLARTHAGPRPSLGRRRDRARPVGAGAPRLRRRLGPTQGAAVPLLRRVRLPGAGLRGRRRVRALPRAHGGVPRVGQDHQPVPATSSRVWKASRGSPTTARSYCRRARSSTPRWSR